MRTTIVIGSGLGDSNEVLGKLIFLANKEIEKNTGMRTGKLTLIEVDRLIDELEFKFLNPKSSTHPITESWARGLFIIDAVLKPNDLEVHKGYQQARLSYIAEKELDHYYKCLDNGRERNPNNVCRAIISGLTQFIAERSESCK